MSAYPDLRPSVTGHWPPRITDLPVGVPVLGESVGLHRGTLVGWTNRPESAWRPDDGDLLWTPPATKSLDAAGEIVDVKTFENLPGRSWVTAQLGKRDRWLEVIRQRVKAGTYRLTPAMAKLLGLDDDGALLEDRAAPSNARVMAELDALIQRTAN